MATPINTRDQAKARARALRAEYAADNRPISHSAALEHVAREAGYSGWNAMSARLSNQPEVPLHVGDRVAGAYLKRPFDGTVLAVRSLSDGAAFEVTIDFDAPVVVVAFEGFSHSRRRVTATISAGGVSCAKTRDGVPHMVVGRAPEALG